MLVNNFHEEPSLKPSHQLSAVYHSQCVRYGHIFFIKTFHNFVGEVQLKIPAGQITNSPFMWFSIYPCIQAFRCDFQLVLADSSLKIKKKQPSRHSTMVLLTTPTHEQRCTVLYPPEDIPNYLSN